MVLVADSVPAVQGWVHLQRRLGGHIYQGVYLPICTRKGIGLPLACQEGIGLSLAFFLVGIYHC